MTGRRAQRSVSTPRVRARAGGAKAGPIARAAALLAFVVALVFAPVAAPAQSPLAPAEPEAAAPDAAEAARILADALRDPDARAALIAQLEAAGAAAPDAVADESFDAALTRAVADRTRAFAENVSAEALEFAETISDWDDLSAQAAAVDWSRFGDEVTAVGIVVAVTASLFYVLRRLTDPLRRRFANRAGNWSVMGKLARLAAIGASDLALILLAWGAGYAVALWSGGAAVEMDVRQSLFLNAFLVVEVGRLVLRLILCARRPTLRLIPIGNAAAKEIYVRLARILSVLGYGMLLAVPVFRSALGPKSADWLALGVALFAAWMAIRLVRRNRLAVRAAIEARAARRGADGSSAARFRCSPRSGTCWPSATSSGCSSYGRRGRRIRWASWCRRRFSRPSRSSSGPWRWSPSGGGSPAGFA